MNKLPRIGIVGLSDGDPEVHEQLKAFVQNQVDAIVEALTKTGQVEVVQAQQLVHSVKSAKEQAEYLRNMNVDGTILSHGVFAFPNFSAIIGKNGKGPFLVAANLNPDWPGMVSMLAAGGALNQLGIDHYRVAGDVNEPAVLDKYLQFARCAKVVSRLQGQKYGLIGGRSLGMYSATVNMRDWQAKFGIDIEHIDQSEIVRIAGEIDDDLAEKGVQWLEENTMEIRYNDTTFTRDKLLTQVKHYEALKRIIAENELDFVGVKCHYEMSRHFCTECISAAFCNDKYDWNGPKEAVVMACEADSDAALTMQIMKLLTDDPILFMDVRHYDKEYDVMVFCNCGSQSTYYGGKSDDYKENLKHVTLYPALDIYAGGGCHVNMMTAPGDATIARLTRDANGYKMTLFNAEFVTLPREKMKETTEEWPHVFAKLDFDYNIFLERFDANHCHAVYGDHVDDLCMICEMLEIPVEILGKP